eukprot:m.341491 g.341491  ORF g.341491 m.341491 type:complete len:362 (-) comp20611_c0_seq2:1514-2599(-)
MMSVVLSSVMLLLCLFQYTSASVNRIERLLQLTGSDPNCTTGITPPGDNVCCCAKDCGKCGGSNCQDHPGGEASCCCGAIAKSGRSCSEYDPPCNMPLPPMPPAPPPRTQAMPKRGFVADGKDQNCDDPLLLNVSGWFYNYNVLNPFRSDHLPGNCALANSSGRLNYRFTPMDWCLSGMHGDIPSYVNRTFFMGFNEPNDSGQCNLTPQAVAAAYANISRTWSTSILVSPATAGNGTAWYDAFFAECKAMYGPSGCNISYLATHCYSCVPTETLKYLKYLYDRYGLKVWLTEFSCGDHRAEKSTAQHMEFMREIIPLLDQADYVYRYAWMSARDSSNLRGLVETVNGSAKLTHLGQFYNAL